MKKIIAVILSLIFALLIVFGLPILMPKNNEISANIQNNHSLVPQEILSYDEEEKTYNKLYYDGKLVAVISDLDYLNSLIKKKYKDYEFQFPNTDLDLGDELYISTEKSYARFENVDDKIMDYLVKNNLLGVKTTAIKFSTSNGVYDIIYVKDYEDFSKAMENFYLNFISQDTLNTLRNNGKIASPSELGTVETGVQMYETISREEAVVSPDKIMSSVDQIYKYLCYGDNEERNYYTVKEGDTLQGVGYYFGDMTPKQIVMLNPDVLSSENQVVVPGMELNVTYYTSPVTIEVTKERLSQQYIVPEVPEYVEDDSLEIGEYVVRVQEETGIKNVLYEEKWVNGVLDSGTLLSENIIKQAKRGVIAVGTKPVYMVGTGNYIWPVDNPHINCHFGCYWGHTGTDFTNRYERYAPIYAVDSGVATDVGYKYDMGYYVIIDHQNGVRTMYMHLNTAAYVVEGEGITRGQVIGQMGNTGRSEGVHLHLTFEVNGVRVNACNYLPCSLAG